MGLSAFYTAAAAAAERRNGPGEIPHNSMVVGVGGVAATNHMLFIDPANNRLSGGGLQVREKRGRVSPVAGGKRRTLHG